MTIRKISWRMSYIVMGLMIISVISIVRLGVQWYSRQSGSQVVQSSESSLKTGITTQLMEFAGWEYKTASGDVYLFDRTFTLRIISTMPRFDTQTGWTYGLIKAHVHGIGTDFLVSELYSIENIHTLPFTSIQYAYLTDQADRFITTRNHYLFHAIAGIIVYVPRSIALRDTSLQSFPNHTCYSSWEGLFDDQQVFVMTLCAKPNKVSQKAKADHSIFIGDMIMYIRATNSFYSLNQIMLFPEQEFLSFIPSEDGNNKENNR